MKVPQCIFILTLFEYLGFGLHFEWSKSMTSEVTVHVSESDDEDDGDDDDDADEGMSGFYFVFLSLNF